MSALRVELDIQVSSADSTERSIIARALEEAELVKSVYLVPSTEDARRENEGPNQSPLEVDLDILVCDAEPTIECKIAKPLKKAEFVKSIRFISSIESAQREVENGSCNVIFIDPYTVGLPECSRFVFGIRGKREEVAFVLYTDLERAMGDPEFFEGERMRWRHYYTMDKRWSDERMSIAIPVVLMFCRVDLDHRLFDNTSGDRISLNILRDMLGEMQRDIKKHIIEAFNWSGWDFSHDI